MPSNNHALQNGVLRLQGNATEAEIVVGVQSPGFKSISLSCTDRGECSKIFNTTRLVATTLDKAGIRRFEPIVVDISSAAPSQHRELLEWFGERGIKATIDS